MSKKAIKELKLLEQDVKDMYSMYKKKELNMTQKEKDEFSSVLQIIRNGTRDMLKVIESN